MPACSDDEDRRAGKEARAEVCPQPVPHLVANRLAVSILLRADEIITATAISTVPSDLLTNAFCNIAAALVVKTPVTCRSRSDGQTCIGKDQRITRVLNDIANRLAEFLLRKILGVTTLQIFIARVPAEIPCGIHARTEFSVVCNYTPFTNKKQFIRRIHSNALRWNHVSRLKTHVTLVAGLMCSQSRFLAWEPEAIDAGE